MFVRFCGVRCCRGDGLLAWLPGRSPAVPCYRRTGRL